MNMKKYLALIPVALALFSAQQANAAFTKAQTGVHTAWSTGTSMTSTFASAPATGDLVIVGINFYNASNCGTLSSVTDGNGNAFTVTTATTTNASNSGCARVAYELSAPSNATKTITATFTTNPQSGSDIWADDFTVSGGTVSLDSSSTGSGSGATITTPTTTVSGSGDLLYGVGSTAGSGITAASSPWTGNDAGVASDGNYTEYDLSASVNTAVKFTQHSAKWNSVGISFKLTASGAPDATSASTTINGDGAKSGDTITITGTNFGTATAGNRATCNGGAGTGCIQFIAGGTDTVADGSISSWTNTAITFTVSSTLNSNGGASALQVWAANASDTTPLTYYIYPNITSIASVGSSGLPAGRTYNASDTDGLVMLAGDHFGTSGTSSILGVLATQYGSTGGSCTTGGYTSTSACFEVPSTINSSTYAGNIILTRGSDNKQASSTATYGSNGFSILPRITAVNPTSTYQGQVVQILGDHLCGPSGTCPSATTSTTNHVAFGGTTSTVFVNLTGGAGVCNGSGNAWAQGEICIDLPALSAGSASATITSNSNISNAFSFTATNPPVPGAPGQPTYSGVNSSTLTLAWSGSTGIVSYYAPQRSTSSAFTAPTALATTTATSTGDSSLTANTTYFFRVQAWNAGGSSTWSASSSQLTLPDVVPSAPTETNVGSSTLTVGWTAPSTGAAYYLVQRATSSAFTAPTSLATTTATSTGDSSLTPLTTYYYRVEAWNTTGAGAWSANSSSTTTGGNSPPNAPTELTPAASAQDVGANVSFTMVATDPESNALQYKVSIYTGSGCTGSPTQVGNENSSQSGWSGQNASSSHEYSSGSTSTYAATLSVGTVYSWTASAIDPDGSNMWSSASACGNFATPFAATYGGTWTTNAGSWATNGSTLAVTPSGGTPQISATSISGQTNVIVEFKAKSTANGNTFYEFRDAISGGTTITPLLTAGGGGPSVPGSTIVSGGNIGLIATSTGVTFTFDDFAAYTGTTITMNNLPSGGCWGIETSTTTVATSTGNTINLSSYAGQIPIDYDNGGGTVAAWTNATCSGAADQSLSSASIFGGDTYTYASSTGGGAASTGGAVVATSSITVNSTGAVSF